MTAVRGMRMTVREGVVTMASKEAEDQATPKASGRKRLARAKVKREKRSDDAGTKASQHLSEAARAKKRKETARNIGITVFAVIIAFAMALPSLSTIFANNQQNAAAQDAAEEATEEGTSEDASDADNMEKVDENYTTTITPLEEKLEEDPEDLATLLNLGEDYRAWAYAASAYVGTDEDAQDHVNELFEQAIDYYDQYLELNDSVAVKINRALCVFYSGTTQDGIDAMTKLTEDYPDSASAWANLGLLYESTYQTDKAKENYQKAAEVDADGSAGIRSFANTRIASMNSSNVERPSDTIESTTPSTTGLSQELLDASNTSF